MVEKYHYVVANGVKCPADPRLVGEILSKAAQPKNCHPYHELVYLYVIMGCIHNSCDSLISVGNISIYKGWPRLG